MFYRFSGWLFFPGICYAATSIQVHFMPLTFYFDGVKKELPSGQKAFIYNGSTYVPLRFMAKSLGKEVSYNSKTNSIIVGAKGKYQRV
jgi:hypothetical protein